MIEVCNTVPTRGTDTLRCESYSTPRTIGVESSLGTAVSKDPEDATSAPDDPSPTKGVKAREGVHSAPPHFSHRLTQTLTEALLDDSEQRSLDDILLCESSVPDDWSEAASGWGLVVPYPKYTSAPPPPRTRFKSETSLKRGGGVISARATVRCVNDDFTDGRVCPSWKANVEPVTYRYVPNNGHYRNNKGATDFREPHILRKNRHERRVVTPEIRQVQKTLKRDLDNHFKATAVLDNADNPESSVPSSASVPYRPQIVKPQGEVRERNTEITHIVKRLPAKEQQRMKSASDLFMENFNTRLNALQKEICTPYGPVVVKKVIDSSCSPNHTTTQITRKLREARVTEASQPTIQNSRQHSGNFGEDLFTVISMNKPEVPLRPLEKLTPKQKKMEKNASREMSPTPDMSLAEDDDDEEDEDEDEDEEMMIMLAAVTSQPPSHPKDHAACGINTARSQIAMTNIDIEKTRNTSLRQSDFGGGGGGGKSKSLAVFNKGAMRYTMNNSNGRTPEQAGVLGEDMHVGDFSPRMERQMDKDLGSIGAALPEIMGKRLTVATTTHRLL